MLKTFTIALKFVQNLDNVRRVAVTVYVAIGEIVALLNYLKLQTEGTKKGQTLELYINKGIDILALVKSLIEKYGKYISLVIPSAPVAAQSPQLLQDLDRSKEYLKILIK